MSNIEVVQALIAAGADVNEVANNGITALMLASAKNAPALVKALLDAGALVNAKNDVRDM
jgi:ankyrin repeat protein